MGLPATRGFSSTRKVIRMTHRSLSQARLRELLQYDPETGVFVWLQSRRATASRGSIAGSNHKSRHRIIRIDGVNFYAHRLAWIYVHGPIPDGMLIDHINGQRADNRIKNLRVVTHKGNMDNLGIKHTPSKLQIFLKNRENT